MTADELVGFGAAKAAHKFSIEWRQLSNEERFAYKADQELGRAILDPNLVPFGEIADEDAGSHSDQTIEERREMTEEQLQVNRLLQTAFLAQAMAQPQMQFNQVLAINAALTPQNLYI